MKFKFENGNGNLKRQLFYFVNLFCNQTRPSFKGTLAPMTNVVQTQRTDLSVPVCLAIPDNTVKLVSGMFVERDVASTVVK